MAKTINSRIPEGPVAEKWTNYKAHQRLVNPKNKLKLDIIVVGTGLAGASAAASLGEMGFRVLNFCIQDSPRRAHSIAAQGGINAAKNYQNDGDSVYRLFYDTVKGGDYRAREANVYRLAEVSNDIIDQCVAQGVPFAREYGGMLANRSFGGAQVSRTFYAKGQTGQQLLLGAYSALSKQVSTGRVLLYTRYEMEDVVIVDGRARGIIAKNLISGKLERFSANAVVIATGGYGNAYFLSTNAMGCNCTAAVQCYRKGAYFANPCYVQIHPTCIPVHGDKQSKLTLMSESLRNDGRIWVPKKLEDAKAELESKYGIKVLAVQADVNAGADNESVVKNVVEQAVKEFGRIDVLINNAQASASGVTIADHTTAQFDLAIYSGLYAAFYYMQACYPYLKETKGSVINFASGAGLFGNYGQCAYAAAKEGIRGLTRVAATEWGPDGINVNIVCPLAWTAQLEKFEQAYPDAFKANVKMPPAGHYADAEKEIGRVCVQLASPDFKYMSGETLTLEGGMGQRP